MIRETGRVWSGAVITPRGGRMFVGITGRWQVPAVTLPLSAGHTAEGQRVCSSSTWIGLDGARSYLHSSLPQIGTAQNVVVKNGRMEPEYFAWTEWWCAGHISSPHALPLPVDAGDVIECTLTVHSPTDVTFHITNHTKNRALDPIPARAPKLPPVAGSASPRIQRLISGATAEWITERPSNSDPSDPNVGKPYDLANYGRVVFENCFATAAPDPAGTTRDSQTFAQGGVTLRDMVRIRENRAELISSAQLMGSQSVATFYRGQ